MYRLVTYQELLRGLENLRGRGRFQGRGEMPPPLHPPKKPCLYYSIAKSSLKVPLTFNKVKKTKRENVNSVHLLSSFFFSDMHTVLVFSIAVLLQSTKAIHVVLTTPLHIALAVQTTSVKQVPDSKGALFVICLLL